MAQYILVKKTDLQGKKVPNEYKTLYSAYNDSIGYAWKLCMRYRYKYADYVVAKREYGQIAKVHDLPAPTLSALQQQYFGEEYEKDYIKR
jgi:hypothetical protein